MICDQCNHEASVYTRKATRSGMKTVCRSCQTGRVRTSVYNPFAELVLDHVRDHNDRPVHVSSLRQLREVEKQHHCVSLIANSDERNFDTPPQKKSPTVADQMGREGKWLYPEIAEPMYREMREAGEVF